MQVEQSRYTIQPFTLAREGGEKEEADDDGEVPPLRSTTSRQLKSV